MVANKSHLERNIRFKGIAQRGAIAAIGYWHNYIRVDGKFPRQLFAHLNAHFVDAPPGNRAVRAGKVDILENAKGAAFLLRKSLQTAQAMVVDRNNFPWFHLADEFGMD